MKDLTVLYKQHSPRGACRFHRVCDHDYGLTGAVDLTEKTQKLVRGFGVERPGRLVGKYQLGGGYQSPRNCGALLLTARYLIRIFFQYLGDPELFRNGEYFFTASFYFDAYADDHDCDGVM